MPADPVVSPADTIWRAIWHSETCQRKPGCDCGYCAAQAALDALLAVGERDSELQKALTEVGLSATASVDDLIQHHRNNAALAAAFDKAADRERDRQQIARLTEALRREYVIRFGHSHGFKIPTAGEVDQLVEKALAAVLADEDDAGNG